MYLALVNDHQWKIRCVVEWPLWARVRQRRATHRFYNKTTSFHTRDKSSTLDQGILNIIIIMQSTRIVLILFLSPTFQSTNYCDGTFIDWGSFAFGLIAGRGAPFLSEKGFVGYCIPPLGVPYTGFACGAWNGWASVLKTTGVAHHVRYWWKYGLGIDMYAQLSMLIWFGSSNVRYLKIEVPRSLNVHTAKKKPTDISTPQRTRNSPYHRSCSYSHHSRHQSQQIQ